MVLSIVILCIVFFSLGGYFIYKIKQTNKRIDKIYKNLKTQIDENFQLKLNHINKEANANKKIIFDELVKLENNMMDNIHQEHQKLLKKELKVLREDMDNDIKKIVESVQNIKIY